MNVYIITSLITATSSIVLGLFVFFRNRKRLINITWALMSLGVAIWSGGYFVWQFCETYECSLFWSRTLNFGAIIIPVFFFHFVLALLEISKQKGKLLKLGYIITAVFLLCGYSHLYVKDVSPKLSFNYYPDAGILHPIFLIIMYFGYVGYACYLLVKFQSKVSGIKRNQLKYVLLGAAFGFLGGATNFFLMYDISILPFGTHFVLLYVFLISYAITRHQLMEIEVVIKRTLVFAGLFSFIFGSIALVTFITQDLLGKYIGISRFWALTMGVIIIVLLHDPVKKLLTNVTNKFLFQKKYDPAQLLKTFTDEVLTVLNLERIVNSTIDILGKTLNLRSCAILLLNRTEDKYEIYNSYGLKDARVSFDSDSKLTSFLGRTHELVLREGYGEQAVTPDAIKQGMDKIGSELCIPLILHDEMIGILSLGRKKSDEPYTRDDIDILSALAKAEAIAISNARLFVEAAQNEKLAAIGTLAAGINHEVCNPLNTMSTDIQVFLEGLKRGLYKDKTSEEIVNEAKRIMEGCIGQINRTADITRKLSSFAKPIKEARMEAVSISDGVDEALSIVGHELELGKIEVEKDIPKDLPHIHADKGQIQQIFFNLIRNAAQAIEGTGRITIAARRASGDMVQVEITDTGRGIPEDRLGKIYDPFFTTRAPDRGTGLGLSIVRQLIGRNRGKISVKSKVEEGTTFSIEFPIAT